MMVIMMVIVDSWASIMITYKKDKQKFLLLRNFQKQSSGGTNAKYFELRNHTHAEETSSQV